MADLFGAPIKVVSGDGRLAKLPSDLRPFGEHLLDVADQARRDLIGANEARRLLDRCARHWIAQMASDPTLARQLTLAGIPPERTAWMLPAPSDLQRTRTQLDQLVADLVRHDWLATRPITPTTFAVIPGIGTPFRTANQ